MGQMLIYILGTFVGILLVVAGAVNLGPQFREGTNNSRASAAVQMVSQVAAADNMYTVQVGVDAPLGTLNGTHALVQMGFLKSVPNNPTSTDSAHAPAIEVIEGSRVITMPIYDNGEKICRSINRQTTMNPNAEIPTSVSQTMPVFCYATGQSGANAIPYKIVARV